MEKVKKMNYGNKDEVLKSILKKYLVIDGNLLKSEKLFMAKSSVNWVFEHTKNSTLIKQYLKEIENYLSGDIDLSWKNGQLIKKKVDKNDKNVQ